MLILEIRNVGGKNDSSNYAYSVFINHKKIASGVVIGHNRDDGWENLVRQIIDERRNGTARKDDPK